MEEHKNDLVVIPFAAHESGMDRMKSANIRLFILCIILIVALVVTNVMWVLYTTRQESAAITLKSTNGYNNFIGNDGDINYEESGHK